LPVLEDQALLEAARRLRSRWDFNNLLITLGQDGMLLFQKDVGPHHIPSRVREVFDVSGAGDTAIATLTLALASESTPVEAAELASRACEIVVGKVGTAVVTSAELANAYGTSEDDLGSGTEARDTPRALASRRQSSGGG
jgi:bifunctional ADP-heptose synthase (sugar kinase/adenylyltransferase)